MKEKGKRGGGKRRGKGEDEKGKGEGVEKGTRRRRERI